MGAAAMPDPLSYLPAPSAANAPSGISVVSLPNGIQSTSGTTVLASNTVYIVGGNGIQLSGNASLTGTNVMIYVSGPRAAISMTGNGAVNLSPMSSGPYEGIVLFQDRSDSNGDTLTGNGNLNITGTIYTPNASITAVGNGTTDVFGSQIISNSLTTKGNGTVNDDFDSNPTSIPPTRNLGLVE
jgi:hypothetical protein